MASNSPIRTAVIGYGLSAKVFHIPFIQALPNLFSLYGILQRSPTDDNSAAVDYPDIKTWTSFSDMIKDENVDLVVVGSVPGAHFEQCKEALDAGKHVLCEKPFTPTSSEAFELGKIAKEKGRVLCVYQNRRWDADFITLQKLVNEGTLGRIVEIESHFDRFRPAPPTSSAATWKFKPQPGVGAIYDLGTHLLDQLVTLLGVPDRITAFIGNQRVYTEQGTGADIGGDSFTVHLHYDKRGLLAIAKASVVSAEKQQLRFWVHGDKGSFKKYNLDVQEDQLKEGLRPGHENYGIEAAEVNGTLTTVDPTTGAFTSSTVSPQSPPDTYVKLYDLLAQAIKGEGPIPVTAEQAASVLRVVELAKQSSNEGRTVVVDAQ